ncbi:MAG: hypothetical protein QOG62_2796, partial [Thermoleophilaceae bacterium]|nr:hypothetical protein [Thermoleophilaceae bacterium]
ALDWLNNATTSGFNFFGLEIELWRIGDSPMAPKFNVVSKPNDWSRAVREQAATAQSGQLTEFQRLHLEFWTQFRKYLEDRGSHIKMTRPSKDHWSNVPVGRSYFTLVPWNGMRDNRSGVHLSLTGPDAKAHFQLLLARHRADIEATLAPFGTVDWRFLAHAKESQVQVVRPSTPSKPDSWPDLNAWMAGALEAMHAVFSPLVRTLYAADWVPQGATVAADDTAPISVPIGGGDGSAPGLEPY